MASSEGRHEIEAARARLTAARAQAAAAAKHRDLLAKAMEQAEALLTSSNKEVGAAEKGLQEAEERWEVIDVDAADAAAENGGKSRKKRKKVSLSPEAARGNAAHANGAPARAPTNNGATSASSAPSANANASTNSGSSIASPNARPASAASANNHQGRVASRGKTRSMLAAARAATDNGAANAPVVVILESGTSANARTPTGNGSSVGNRGGSSSAPGQRGRFHLTQAAKSALREAVFSALRHPSGEVDAGCLERAMAQGLPRQAILNAAKVARTRDRENRERERNAREQTQPRQQSRRQQQREKIPEGSAIPKKHVDALVARIKKMISDAATMEQEKGANIFYWNIMNGNQMSLVARKVPRTMSELAEIDLPTDLRSQYGERIVKTVNEYLREKNLYHYVVEANNIRMVMISASCSWARATAIRMVMSSASCSWARAAAALKRFNGDTDKAIMSLAT